MTTLDHPNQAANLNDVNARTTAQGLFNYGDAYLGSAHALKDANAQVIFPDAPVRFLLYHAAEMHLKSFLRAAGMTVAELHERGHKFSRLIPAARGHGLGLDRESEALLLYGQRTGDIIESRYIRTGPRRYFETDTLGRCAASVRRAVRLNPQRVGHVVLWGEQTGIIDDRWERAWGL
jgi:HEPN domain-containing protein